MRAPYDLDDGAAARAAIGLIVLSTDETMEPEFASILPGAGAAIFHARIPFAPEVTPETLARMADALPATAALLPDRAFDVIGYGCTSGATVIGPERVAELIRSTRPAKAVTDPLSATIAACRALGVSRLGFVTPYVAEVSAAMRARLEAAGLEIAAFASFEEESDARVARITEASTLAAMRSVGEAEGVEAVFASCTNLRAFGVIEAAEAALGKPVISSNLALAWDVARLSGAPPKARPPGRLWLR